MAEEIKQLYEFGNVEGYYVNLLHVGDNKEADHPINIKSLID